MPRPLNTLGDARTGGQELVAVCDDIRCRHKWLIDLDHVIKYVGEMHPLMPVRGQTHFSERMRCPACKGRGVYVWMGVPREPVPSLGTGFGQKINNWGSHGGSVLIQTVAQVGHIVVAHATFDAARAAYPRDHLTLQEGMRVLRDSRVEVITGGKKFAG